jgi:hypothetical protein
MSNDSAFCTALLRAKIAATLVMAALCNFVSLYLTCMVLVTEIVALPASAVIFQFPTLAASGSVKSISPTTEGSHRRAL